MDFAHISKCPVLKGLTPEEIDSIFHEIHFNIRQYNKDNLVMIAGEECENLMILISGQVRGELQDFTGNIVKIEDISAPKPIAPAFLFGEMNVCPVSIIANEPTRILFIPKDQLIRLYQKNGTILKNYLDIISNRSQFLSRKVRLLSLKNLKQKIAYFLLDQNDQSFGNRTTQRELAEILGVTRPALARTIGQLENEGTIEYSKGYIRILDKHRLSEILHSTYKN